MELKEENKYNTNSIEFYTSCKVMSPVKSLDDIE